ncbi:xanthine dehydrogenase family protein subunit M [Sphingobacterium oryzagri]|uniref:Xanthine dehydrogenase family protein subunit M n=1 Tax=Sphingobacterium oryzagri TaxID=3025669 RepID=A0ABY7WB00_9SPHI|nr:xanthine dehydrogenase family protein subunit M [Sphingobacterium sp. KACC 22765]WDF66813.1 xanthine dehydrogenase family protein subunit M [Sphingobacterium sp. KACC 22765]
MINFQYVRVNHEKQLFSELKQDKGQIIAGGTNLVDLMKKGIESPERLIDVNGLDFKEIKEVNGKLFIGALALNSTVSEHPLIRSKYPLLAEALQAGASQQIRNVATVGGNMLQRTRCAYFYNTDMACNKREQGTGCSAKEGFNRMHAIFGTSDSCIAVHPSDMCVALAALDAVVLVKGARKVRTIPFAEFHLLPGETPWKETSLQKGEFITGIEIPTNNLHQHANYLKHRDRASYAFAVLSVAAAFELQGNAIQEARLAMGGVAHKPWRLFDAEQFLKGKLPTEENFEQAATIAMRGAKGYGGNDFKLELAPKTIVEALKRALQSASLT